MDPKHKKRIFWGITFLIIVLGGLFHVLNPSVVFTGKNQVSSNEYIVIPIKQSNIPLITDYFVNIRVSGHYSGVNVDPVNMSVIILTPEEYISFNSTNNTGTQILGVVDENYQSLTHKYEFCEERTSCVDYYLIIRNNVVLPLEVFYYIGSVPFTYYFGLIMVTIGILGILSFVLLTYERIESVVVLAFGVNILTILFRMLTLGGYNSIDLKLAYDFIFHQAITPELWNDFEAWYLPWVEPFLNGAFPYGELQGYEFPPLFILTIAFFEQLPILPIWKAGIPIFTSHLLTGIIIYYITRELYPNNKIRANLAVLCYYLNPISLVYGAFCWLNPPIFIFFSLLALYFLLRSRRIHIAQHIIDPFYLSMVCLAIATMYKQFAAIFLIPFLIIYYYRKKNCTLRLITLGSAFYFSVIGLICIPFILTDFESFIRYTLFSTTVFTVERSKIIHLAFPVNFNSFFSAFYFPSLITDIIGFLVVWWILLVISLIWTSFGLTEDLKKRKVDTNLVIFGWLSLIIICVHIFYPRGSYKYYLLLLMPFMSLFIGTKPSTKREISVLMVFFGLIVLINRFVYFNLLIILIGYLAYYLQKNRRVTVYSK